ncbi:tetraspanin-9-like [Saccoglossus kowalevskii]
MAEIGAGVFIYFMEEQFITYVHMAWNFLDQITINLVQSQLHCCGFLNYTEYVVNEQLNISLSCYSNVTVSTTLYDIGCYDKFVDMILDNVTTSAIIGGSLVLFEIVGILFTCYLMKAIEKENNTEPKPNRRRRRSTDSIQDNSRGRREKAWDI